MDLGERLRSLRAERGLSQDALAAACRLSRGTIQNAEASKDINASTALLILQALDTKAAVSYDDLRWFAKHTSLSERVLIAMHETIYPQEASRNDELHAALDELVAVTDREYVRGVLDALRIAALGQRGLQEARERILVAKSPPVQREGYVEHTEREYVVKDAPAPARPIRKHRPA